MTVSTPNSGESNKGRPRLIFDRPVPIEAIADDRLVGPAFHPGEPAPEAWRAGNTPASQLGMVMAVWTNMATYIQASKSERGLKAKLQLKAALVELKTLIDILPGLNTCIATQKTFEGRGLKPFISLTPEERKKAGAAYKLYNQAKSRVETKVLAIRNNIGAHAAEAVLAPASVPVVGKPKRAGERERLTWEEVVSLWENLELKHFAELIQAIQHFLGIAKDLPIYEWYRFEPDGTLRTHLPLVGTMASDGRICMQMMSSELAAKFCGAKLVVKDTFLPTNENGANCLHPLPGEGS